MGIILGNISLFKRGGKIIKMKNLLLPVIVIALQACAPKSYLVQEPVPSNVTYEKSTIASSQPLIFSDSRSAENKKFSYGILNADLLIAGKALQPIEYLKRNAEIELLKRGIPASLDDNNALNVDIKTMEMKNHRLNGFSPFVTFTFLKADIDVSGKKEPIAVFIRRGKVPVWSFDEIIQPTLNEPLDLLVKEFTAKVNANVYGQKISDEEVNKLIKKINNGGTYLDVYQLGFGNNKSAAVFLKELTKSSDEYKRQAAISSLGILKIESEFEYLKSLYANGGSWADKAMALKAIGDLRTSAAIDFLKQEQKSFATDPKKYWVNDLVNLYI